MYGCIHKFITLTCIRIYIALPAADMTFSANAGNEKVRKTIVADAAILAPSPESFTVTLVGCAPSNSSS